MWFIVFFLCSASSQLYNQLQGTPYIDINFLLSNYNDLSQNRNIRFRNLETTFLWTTGVRFYTTIIAVFRPERIILPGCNQSATFLHLQEHDKRLSSSLISPHQFHPNPVANARLITPRLPASTRLPGTLFLRQSFLQLYFQTIKPWRFTTFHDCSSRTSQATFSTRQTLRFPATNSPRNELEPILATKSQLIYIWSIFRARSPRSSSRRFEFKYPAAKFITKRK